MYKIYPVEYEVCIYDENSIKENKQETIHGITFAESYADAMYNIEQYYKDLIINITLFMNEENSIYELDSTSDYHESGWFKIKNLEKTF